MNTPALGNRNIRLVREGTGEQVSFLIEQTYRRGSTVICYKARKASGGPAGVLREFCPAETQDRHFSFERNADGFLHPTAGMTAAAENFIRARNEYTAAYHRIMNAQQLHEDKLLHSFIPQFEIYYSAPEGPDYTGTVFIWTDRILRTGDEVCADVHHRPTVRPERKLALILDTVLTLSKCIRALHAAGYIHRDIKPSNFGFIERDGEILTQTLMMYDIDSIWDIDEDMPNVMGTPGFMAPEMTHGEPDNRADIYSIGAVLFYAVIITDETRAGEFLYRPEYYDRLEELVDRSELLQASEQNFHPRLRQYLVKILQNCLNPDRAHRYRSCRHLIEDLQQAMSYVMPGQQRHHGELIERWVLTDSESAFDRRRRKNSVRQFRCFLYEHPLFERQTPDDKIMRVLVLGFGNYGQKFTDVVLQTGQTAGRQLAVTIVSMDESDFPLYLKKRPALVDLFSFSSDGMGPCGCLDFRTVHLQTGQCDVLTDQLRSLAAETGAGTVFISLADDDLNLLAANVCTDTENHPAVAFLQDTLSPEEEFPDNMFPLQPGGDVGKKPVYREIDRMAFCYYILRRGGDYPDLKRLKRRFHHSSVYDECFAAAVAVRYITNSIGLDSRDADTAEKFAGAIGKTSVFLSLTEAEQRRRIALMACVGWTRMDEPTPDGQIADRHARRHLCLIPCTDGFGLPDAPWENLSACEDALDCASVRLHEVRAARAAMMPQNVLTGRETSAVRALVSESVPASAAFHAWYCCMQDIRAGDRSKIRFYDILRQEFLQTVSRCLPHRAAALEAQIEDFERVFRPLIDGLLYQDLRKEVGAWLRNIPYLLTANRPTALVLPFGTGNHTALFGNVAAAAAADPKKLVFLYKLTEPDGGELLRTVPSVQRFLSRKKLQAETEFLLAYSCRGPRGWKEELQSKLESFGDRHNPITVCFLHIDSRKELMSAFSHAIRVSRGGCMAIIKNAVPLSQVLEEQGLYDIFPSSRFDFSEGRFLECKDCDWLRWIPNHRCLTAADIILFGREIGSIGDQPPFFDEYKLLWQRYRSDPTAWRGLCKLLEEKVSRDNCLAVFRPDTFSASETEVHRYLLPQACLSGAEKLLTALRNRGILGENSVLHSLNPDACELLADIAPSYRPSLQAVLCCPAALMCPEYLLLQDDADAVTVLYDDLMIRGLPAAQLSSAQRTLLDFFAENGLILGLYEAGGMISFTCATRQSKRLLSWAERILEIYVYHSLKQQPGFDDVRAAVTLHRLDDTADDTMDLLVTRGYRGLVVECRDVSAVTPAYCREFSALAGRCGINAGAVLITDACAGELPTDVYRSGESAVPGITMLRTDKELEQIGPLILAMLKEKEN